MEIARMWTLSTAHISRETDKWLIGQVKEPTEGLCVYKKLVDILFMFQMILIMKK